MNEITKEIFKIIKKEQKRQKDTIELIASENFVSKDILKANGSILTNKYAEGYPSKRYYGGCKYVDQIETIAINLAKELFSAEHANVQPHSGSQANQAVYLAVLKPGDKVLALDLNSGGHLTHGHSLSSSGLLYEFHSYGVNKDTFLLDYDEIEKIALEVMPKLIVTGASNYSRIIDFKRFSEIASKVGALLMVDMAHIAGLVATSLHPSPVPYADFVTSTTHKTLRGPRSGLILCKEKYAKIIDRAVFPGIQGGPHIQTIAAKAICFGECMEESFITYQKRILANIKAMEKAFNNRNVSMISGGSDNHLVSIEVYKSLGITGAEAEKKLEKYNITVNKNSIPYDTLPPTKASGLRLGSAAMTSRGLEENDFYEIANLITDILLDKSLELNKAYQERVKNIIDKLY
ncbi:MAG: serine hydroxymethyltransferase [Acholeplasmatales bacterium]|jgi:glycine hydroxymethyltransferase|nr:serine hydroxymethyltransferase [Acholeplasmatales bacterium]